MKNSTKDFNLFLKELGITEKFLKNWMAQMDINNLLELEEEEELYYKKKSAIHGLGLFAKKQFKTNDYIGIVVFEDKRTTLARWTNHSKNNNVKFVPYAHKHQPEIRLICIATKTINKNNELTVNYRNNVKESKKLITLNKNQL